MTLPLKFPSVGHDSQGIAVISSMPINRHFARFPHVLENINLKHFADV